MLRAPALLPDEPVGSGIVRFARQYLLPLKTLAREVLGMPNLQPRLLAFSQLHRFEEPFRLPLERLLTEHTVFNYATAYMSGANYERVLAYVRPQSRSDVVGSLTQNASHGTFGWRYCQKCTAQDVTTYGTSYWRRCHNLPGVTVCYIHARPLREAPLLVGNSRLELLLPHDLDCPPISYGSSARFQLELAKRSAGICQTKTDALDSYAGWYRNLATKNGWMQEGSPVSSDVLRDTVVREAGETMLDRAGILPLRKNAWPGLMMRPGVREPFVPLKHLALAIVLSTPHRRVAKTLTHRSSGPPGTADARVDRFYADAANDALDLMLSEGERDVTTASFLRRVGCLGAYRHRGCALPKLRKVVLRFRRSEASCRRLAVDGQLYRRGTDAKAQAHRADV